MNGEIMKKLLLSLIATAILAQGINAGEYDDKAKHAMVGMLIYTGCFFVKGTGEALKYDMDYLTPTTCLIPVVVAGIGKEIYDSQHDGHTAEVMDAVATVAIPFGIWTIYKW